MNESEYNKIRKKERIFYSILVLVWVIAILLKLTIGFYNGYWIWIITGTIIYLYLKDVFTGLKWSQKLVKPQTNINNKESKLSATNNSPITAREKDGYIMLTKCCVAPEKQNRLISFFENLNDCSKDEDYMTTLNYVMEYSDEQDLFFIMALDWKQDIETLEWRL